jgi:hypothetical protein
VALDHDAMASTGETVSSPAPAAPGLRRNAIGLREVLFQSITDMAPGAAIAASIPAGALYAGGTLPLSFTRRLGSLPRGGYVLVGVLIAPLVRASPGSWSWVSFT